METRLSMKFAALFVATALAAAPALAQTVVAPAAPTTAVAPTTTTASGKLVDSFSTWAGSPENSAALVNGLRSGQPITLTSTTVVPGTPVGTVETTTFTPPTKPMGNGNIRIALALAQQQLASQGITQPTAQQMQAALMGGSLPNANPALPPTRLDGVLQMRASGMGWGKIANTLGYKLGAVMSGKAAPAPAGNSVATAGATAPATPGKAGSGITTAAGTTVTTGKAAHGKDSGTAGSGVSTGFGQGQGHAAGVVSAQGAVHGNAGSNGKGGK